MGQEIISRFREKPKTQFAWRAMKFGLGGLLIPPALGIFGAIIRPLIDPASMEGRDPVDYFGMSVGFGGVLLALFLSVAAFRNSIRAYKMGERSWVLWLGLVPAILVALFWIMMIVGEILFPH